MWFYIDRSVLCHDGIVDSLRGFAGYVYDGAFHRSAGIFAIGAPGVPGGTVIASLGIVISVLGFDETGTALLLTIFALQDSFGTACNVTGDGALTLILSKLDK